jgi:hypothetical protein
MTTTLPGLTHKTHEETKDNKKTTGNPQRNNYKGITLKEYFKICDQPNGAIL